MLDIIGGEHSTCEMNATLSLLKNTSHARKQQTNKKIISGSTLQFSDKKKECLSFFSPFSAERRDLKLKLIT
jgi:hypothetical protein